MIVGILDWGGGNLASVERALRRVGADTVLSADPREMERADRLVFPGVGRFGDVMEGLRARGLDRLLIDAVAGARPVLGICVGLQALFEGSSESPGTAGLGLLRGRVRRFERGKVPQIGWNRVEPAGAAADGAIAPDHYYFVNSYHADPEDESVVAGWTDYHGRFASAVAWRSVLATQFHPEKSGPAGLALLRRWLGEEP